MDFGQALIELRSGEKLTRFHWNGPGQWVELADSDGKMTEPYLFLHDSYDRRIPWTPSQTDVLALDWKVVG
jgi:hypothetical protein